MDSGTRQSFTFAQLLVLLFIVGLLIFLALPALQCMRPDNRRSSCQHNLKQIGLAALNHHDQQGYLPSGGWGEDWTGDPNVGYGFSQPGSWVYNLLPFLEHKATREYGLGQSGPLADASRARVMTIPIATFNCPDRRSATVYPNPAAGTINADDPPQVVRTDYAANGGTIPFTDGTYTITWRGAQDLADWDQPDKWPRWQGAMDGTSYLKSKVNLAMLIDGATFTISFGEKFMDPEHYLDGADPGDRRSMYHGYGRHNTRWTTKFAPPPSDPLTDDDPHQDAAEQIGELVPQLDGSDDPKGIMRFGSAHPGGAVFVFADGHTMVITYEIDPYVFYQLCNRRDRTEIDLSELH